MKRIVTIAALAALISFPALGQERVNNPSPSASDKWEVWVSAATEPVRVDCNGARVQPKAILNDKAVFDIKPCLKTGGNRVSVTVDASKGHTMANHEIRKNGAVASTNQGSAKFECGPNTGRHVLCDDAVSAPGQVRKHDYDLDL